MQEGMQNDELMQEDNEKTFKKKLEKKNQENQEKKTRKKLT